MAQMAYTLIAERHGRAYGDTLPSNILCVGQYWVRTVNSKSLRFAKERGRDGEAEKSRGGEGMGLKGRGEEEKRGP